MLTETQISAISRTIASCASLQEINAISDLFFPAMGSDGYRMLTEEQVMDLSRVLDANGRIASHRMTALRAEDNLRMWEDMSEADQREADHGSYQSECLATCRGEF